MCKMNQLFMQTNSNTSRLGTPIQENDVLSLWQRDTFQHLTPLLLPLDPNEIRDSDIDILHLESAAEPKESGIRKTQELEDVAVGKDAIDMANISTEFRDGVMDVLADIEQFGSLDAVPDSPYFTPPNCLPAAISLKVEPLITSQSSLVKGKHACFEVDPDKHANPLLTSEDDKILLESLLDDDHLEDVASPALDQIATTIQDEEIQSDGIIARVRVPELIDVVFQPPWNCRSPQCKPNQDMGGSLTVLLNKNTKQREVRIPPKLERDMIWAPFSMDINQAGHEDFPTSDVYLETLLKDPGASLQSDEMLWKPDGLRILDQEEEEPEREVLQVEGLNNYGWRWRY